MGGVGHEEHLNTAVGAGGGSHGGVSSISMMFNNENKRVNYKLRTMRDIRMSFYKT